VGRQHQADHAVIDNFERAQKLGSLFEGKTYTSSEALAPTAALDEGTLASILK
jgi:hypothetical protein